VVGNGREDGTIREDLAATNGEKPLKGGCPWTTQHETRLADSRHERSRGRQSRPDGVRPQGRTRRPRERELEGVVGTHRRRADAVPRKRTKHSHPGDDTETKATTRFRGSLSGEPDEGVLQADDSFGSGQGEVDRKEDEAIWREDCGGQVPNANDKGMRGGCTLIRVTAPMKRPRGPTRKGEGRGGCAKPMRRTVIGIDTLESNETRREKLERNEKPPGLRSDRVLLESPYPRGSRAR